MLHSRLNKWTRREFLQRSSVLLSLSTVLRPHSNWWASTPSQPIQDHERIYRHLLRKLAPFPAKQRLLQADYARSGNHSQLLILLNQSEQTLHSASRLVDVVEHNRWDTGALPNYSHAARRNGEDWGWVACFGNRNVTAINVTRDLIYKYDTPPKTNPLDLAYDSVRDRLAVASADLQAQLIVLDGNGTVLYTVALAPLTGQGACDGGVQGVTIDANGHYWCALAYSGQLNGGVLIQVDGETWAVRQIIKDAGMNNPNGLITGFAGQMLFACSDNGYVQQFDLAGTLVRTVTSISTGYRGVVNGVHLWVTGWLNEGRMARVDLETGERLEFPCVALGNSIQIDGQGYVWVAGDAGLSISTQDGELLKLFGVGAFTNGLAIAGDDVYFVSYDQLYRRMLVLDEHMYLPAITSAP